MCRMLLLENVLYVVCFMQLMLQVYASDRDSRGSGNEVQIDKLVSWKWPPEFWKSLGATQDTDINQIQVHYHHFIYPHRANVCAPSSAQFRCSALQVIVPKTVNV